MRYVVGPLHVVCALDSPPLVQERVAILKILKKDFQVNEQLLRVGISCVNHVHGPMCCS